MNRNLDSFFGDDSHREDQLLQELSAFKYPECRDFLVELLDHIEDRISSISPQVLQGCEPPILWMKMLTACDSIMFAAEDDLFLRHDGTFEVCKEDMNELIAKIRRLIEHLRSRMSDEQISQTRKHMPFCMQLDDMTADVMRKMKDIANNN